MHKELRERKQKHEDTWKVDNSLKTSTQEADLKAWHASAINKGRLDYHITNNPLKKLSQELQFRKLTLRSKKTRRAFKVRV